MKSASSFPATEIEGDRLCDVIDAPTAQMDSIIAEQGIVSRPSELEKVDIETFGEFTRNLVEQVDPICAQLATVERRNGCSGNKADSLCAGP